MSQKVLAESGKSDKPTVSIPFTTTPPAISADINDSAWRGSTEIPQLTLSHGSKATLPPQKTRVQLMWDKRFLYLRFLCDDDDVFATLSGRDRDAEYHREDAVEVFLDPVGDGKEYIEIQVSPKNGVRDVLYLFTGEPQFDENGMFVKDLLKREAWSFAEWNFEGLKTAATVVKRDDWSGWIAELAIPANCLRRLGKHEFEPMTLRANFVRLDHPQDPSKPGVRQFVSTNWSTVLEGNTHRSPAANGFLNLLGPVGVKSATHSDH